MRTPLCDDLDSIPYLWLYPLTRGRRRHLEGWWLGRARDDSVHPVGGARRGADVDG